MSSVPRVFLLSPARCGGLRAELLVNSPSELGAALRSDQGAPLGQVFAFLSSLYFRGKLSYAVRFAAPALEVPSALIIVPGHGLCRVTTPVRAADLTAIGRIEVDADNPEFVAPLVRDAQLLAARLPDAAEVVLLGSIATPKYVEPLLGVFGERLLFPSDFVGRGDMSRGGLMLRCAGSGEELTYVAARSAPRHGPRPPRLPRKHSRSGGV